jgi:hypothetical protein
MEFHRTPNGVQITRRWFTLAALFLIPFCLVWDGFLVAWYTTAFKTGAPTAAKLFPIIHLCIGIGVTYWTIASLVNKTRITIERGELIITHSPLPWFGYRRISGIMIDQIYAKCHITHGKNGPRSDCQLWHVNLETGMERDEDGVVLGSTRLPGSQRLHRKGDATREAGCLVGPMTAANSPLAISVFRVNTTGRHEKLHANNLTSDQALYLEQQIEQALRIKDRAIPGELPR